jgi:AraC-like DNA-binding protein
MDSERDVAAAQQDPRLTLAPPDVVRRRLFDWRGVTAEFFDVAQLRAYSYAIRSPRHLLIVTERGVRYDGTTEIEGLPPSTRRDFSRTINFVPAGHRLEGWQHPRIRAKISHFFFDPSWPLLDPEYCPSAANLAPMLFVDSPCVLATAGKLRALAGATGPSQLLYAEALGIVLQHELVRAAATAATGPRIKGGLAPWQVKRVQSYIEENLARRVSLATMAELTSLSPYHFARAFKISLGMPPHRYFAARRVERAKELLASGQGVGDVAFMLGFSEASAFTASFRRATGIAPSGYRRSGG